MNTYKQLLLPIMIFVTGLFACQETQQQAAGSDESVPVNQTIPITDSARIVQVEQVVTDINEALKNNPKVEKFEFEMFTEEDDFKYCAMPDNLEEVSMKVYRENDLDVWPVFFMKNGQTAKYRYREWKRTGNPSAMELQLYFDEKGELFYARERSIDLKPGEKPVPLRRLPFQETTRSKEELLSYYLPYWEQAQEVLARNGK